MAQADPELVFMPCYFGQAVRDILIFTFEPVTDCLVKNDTGGSRTGIALSPRIPFRFKGKQKRILRQKGTILATMPC